MKILEKDIAIHNLKEELKYEQTKKGKQIILGLINLLEQDKIEAVQSSFGSETGYRFKPRAAGL